MASRPIICRISSPGSQPVALSSNVVRHDAHAFYTARGYAPVATSQLFRKSI
jgi:hypothetical protein